MHFYANRMESKCYSFIIALVFCVVNVNGIFARSSGEIYYHGNNISESNETVLYNRDHLEKTDLQAEECECQNGYCENDEKGKPVCKCPSDYGNYSITYCKKCDCGKDEPCYWISWFSTEGWYSKDKKCICKEGYKDANGTCMGPCTNNPCKNGGNCSLEGTTAKCKCMAPYSGDLCETGPCTKNPCQNGGSCRVEGLKAICKCAAPYSGDLCETGPCTKNPCKNGGTCIAEGLKEKCKCQVLYSGDFCETGPCTMIPCKNGGTCTKVGLKAKCQCSAPYSGDFCETGPCTVNPCENGGTCTEVGLKAKCKCSAPYYGDFCENKPCYPNPCRNGGTCTGFDYTKYCICQMPFYGDLCDKIDSCFSNPCQNGGTCLVEGMGFRCQCKDFFSGDKCEKNNRITFYFLLLVSLGMALCFTVICCLFKINQNLKMMLKHLYTSPSTLP